MPFILSQFNAKQSMQQNKNSIKYQMNNSKRKKELFWNSIQFHKKDIFHPNILDSLESFWLFC